MANSIINLGSPNMLLLDPKRLRQVAEVGNIATKDTIKFSDAEFAPDTLAALNAKLSDATLSHIPVYGVKWDQANDVMTKGVVINGAFYTADYQNYEIQDAHVRVMRQPDGAITGYCDPDDSTQYIGGVAVTFDGSEGDLQVQSPRHYQLWTRDGDDIYILVSWQPFSFNGAVAQVPEHFDGDYYYYDALENILYDDSASSLIDGDGNGGADTTADYLRSLPYYKVWTEQTRDDFRSLAANRGGTSHQWGWSAYQALVGLFLTKYGTWNSQSALPGYTEGSGWDFSYTRETGRTLSLGNADGSIEVDLAGTDSDLDGVVSSGDYIANSFLGIENVFGNIWKFVDGINIDNTNGDEHVYTQADPGLFADDTATDYHDTGIAPGFGSNEDYIKDIHGDQVYAPLYPTVLGASSSTYITDYKWSSAGAWRVLLAGGALAYGDRAGLVCLSAADDSSHSSSFIGARSAAR